MEDHQAMNVIEAALLCADGPMPKQALQKLFEPEEVTLSQIDEWLVQLQSTWKDRGLELTEISTGWRFQSRVQMQRYLEKLNPERTPKYSRAVLETLAIIAWKQPVTRADIEAIRGVTVSSQIVKTLEERGWVETLGHRDGPGRPALLGTTKQFLNDLGLRALDELPPLQPLSPESPELAGLPEGLLVTVPDEPAADVDSSIEQTESTQATDQYLPEMDLAQTKPEKPEQQTDVLNGEYAGDEHTDVEHTDVEHTDVEHLQTQANVSPEHPMGHVFPTDPESEIPEQK